MINFSDKLLRPVWAEIDLDALRHNFNETVKLVGKDTKIIAALKCDANGFGGPEIAQELISMGAFGVAFANLFEAVNLREKGFKAPILLYANNLPYTAETVINYNLTPTVTNLECAGQYSEKAKSTFNVFVKVDVGLNRIGVLAENAVGFVEKLLEFKNLSLGGLYTHFHFSEDELYINYQFNSFKDVISGLESKGIEIPLKMASATPSILFYPQTYLNAVDPGRLILGNTVVARPRQNVSLKPLLKSLKTKIIEIKTLKPRETFETDRPFPVPQEMKIGVLPIGWGDGYSKKHSSRGTALVNGKRVAILDGVNFEHTRIDLTEAPNAEIGDEAVLIGAQGEEEITVEEIIKIRGTDMQEVCRDLRDHIPRLYIKNGRPYKLKTTLGETYFVKP